MVRNFEIVKSIGFCFCYCLLASSVYSLNLPKENACEACRKNQYDTPYYCAIKPDLPQCIFPICPKVCEVMGEDNDPGAKLTGKLFVPFAEPNKALPFPLPSYLPRLSLPKAPMPGMGRSFAGEGTNDTKGSTPKMRQEPPPPEDFQVYNEQTCELNSPYLRQMRPKSKYIEYRPANPTYSYKEIFENAARYGLVMAEIRRPEDEHSIAMSSVLAAVSSYGEGQPKIHYAYGLRDHNDLTKPNEGQHGSFVYYTDNSSVTFATIDPRQFGRTDEQCAVLTHVLGGDKRQYLVSRMWNCEAKGTAQRSLYGLLMYPPGSLCYRRSEEECNLKGQEDNGGDAQFHNMIQMGQTLTRFIYLYSDQRTWSDAKAFCEAKGLIFMDFDPKWDDAIRSYQVIEHFLRETKLNPVTMFWTSGKFEKRFTQGKFRWTSTDTEVLTHYGNQAPPFQFNWWDDQKPIQEQLQQENKTHLARRRIIKEPCVALALNPEDGSERPKINFKAWYCDFPSFFLCYKEINSTDNINGSPSLGITSGVRPPPSQDACEEIPPPKNDTSTEEPIDPFDLETCTSKSTTATRLTPASKFVDYRPKTKTFTVDQVKDKCKEFGLVPAEIETVEDWNSISSSGIGGVLSGDASSVKYLYTIGVDDKDELGKYVYSDSKEPIKFSMFYPDGNTDTKLRCVTLDSVAAPDGLTRGLMMHHANCEEGGDTEDEIIYGLCMFPRTSPCFMQSSEETSKIKDPYKDQTMVPIGASGNRSIFFNPVQRTWEDAKKTCEAAQLTLIDFDISRTNDFVEIMEHFKAKLVRKGGMFQLTPIWTAGKLQGPYMAQTGKWETAKGGSLTFDKGPNTRWLKRQWANSTDLREGNVEDGCVEASFNDVTNYARFRPDYCHLPKFFLCTRTSRKRIDPPPSNGLGIYIIETGDEPDYEEDTSGSDDDESPHNLPMVHGGLDNQFQSDEQLNDLETEIEQSESDGTKSDFPSEVLDATKGDTNSFDNGNNANGESDGSARDLSGGAAAGADKAGQGAAAEADNDKAGQDNKQDDKVPKKGKILIDLKGGGRRKRKIY